MNFLYLTGELIVHTNLYLFALLFFLTWQAKEKFGVSLKCLAFSFHVISMRLIYVILVLRKPYEDIYILIEMEPTILGNTWKAMIPLTVFYKISIWKNPFSCNSSVDTGKINKYWMGEQSFLCLNWSCAPKQQYFPAQVISFWRTWEVLKLKEEWI